MDTRPVEIDDDEDEDGAERKKNFVFDFNVFILNISEIFAEESEEEEEVGIDEHMDEYDEEEDISEDIDESDEMDDDEEGESEITSGEDDENLIHTNGIKKINPHLGIFRVFFFYRFEEDLFRLF